MVTVETIRSRSRNDSVPGCWPRTVGSFEQHGRHLPLATDALIATAIAERIAEDYELFRLPVMPLGCSHEHAGFAGTVSISATTLYAVVNDVAASLARSGVRRLVVVARRCEARRVRSPDCAPRGVM